MEEDGQWLFCEGQKKSATVIEERGGNGIVAIL